MELVSKDDLLNKFRAYGKTPDDENIRYKAQIKKALLKCPELLFALHEEEFEQKMFDGDGNIVWDENNDLKYGDEYFGSNSNIRPFLFFPETQTEVKHYLCYQIGFDELPRYSTIQKYTEITFTIFVDGRDSIETKSGISRHDLIASIIRERFNWSNIFGMQTHLVSNKESSTDSNYIVRTLIFQIPDLNGLVNTPYDGKTGMNNYKLRR
jgi:hypothetical protein